MPQTVGSAFSLNLPKLLCTHDHIFRYSDAFFGEDYARENPDHIPIVEACKQELRDQMTILGDCLVVHGKVRVYLWQSAWLRG